MSAPLFLMIVEDDAPALDVLRAHLQENFPQISPLVARSIEEANVLFYQYECSAFIVDVNLPDGSGLEFIVDVKTVFSEALIVISTGVPTDEMNLKAIGKHHLLKKPYDFDLLNPILAAHFGLETTSFSGSIRHIRLVDLIQMKCLGKDTCQFSIQGSKEKGVLRIVEGQIRYAQTDNALAENALSEIISWKKGSFHEEPLSEAQEVNINGSWEFVLMEAVQRSDECLAIEET